VGNLLLFADLGLDSSAFQQWATQKRSAFLMAAHICIIKGNIFWDAMVKHTTVQVTKLPL
jgi:hypothetical protein